MNKLNPPARRPATYQDVIDAPADKIAEIVRGALYLHPRPLPRHSKAMMYLGAQVSIPFGMGRGGPGGWIVLVEPELHLGADVLVPDLAGWRLERLPALPETVGITVSPNWICDVLSPSTRRFDLSEKRASYAAHGVAHLWLVDPQARSLEAQRLVEGTWSPVAMLRDADEVRLPPFDAIAFPLSTLWAD